MLDLSATATVDDQGRTALQSLQRRLAGLTIRLRLVAPEPDVYATLRNHGTGIRHDALHTSVRTAVLAAHADLPGPASATPALRMLLTQPPEPLSLEEAPTAGTGLVVGGNGSGTGSGEVIRSDGYILAIGAPLGLSGTVISGQATITRSAQP